MGQVYPVHNNVFKIGTAGKESAAADMKTPAGLENFKVSIDGKTEEWFPMDQEGWNDATVTGKSFSISFTGKRVYGDDANDYVANKFLATGADAETKFEWVLPNGAKLEGDCIINVTTPGGGDSTAVDGLEFELKGKGKPTFTPAA